MLGVNLKCVKVPMLQEVQELKPLLKVLGISLKCVRYKFKMF